MRHLVVKTDLGVIAQNFHGQRSLFILEIKNLTVKEAKRKKKKDCAKTFESASSYGVFWGTRPKTIQ